MLVSMGHRTSDRVWSSRGCNECRVVLTSLMGLVATAGPWEFREPPVP